MPAHLEARAIDGDGERLFVLDEQRPRSQYLPYGVWATDPWQASTMCS